MSLNVLMLGDIIGSAGKRALFYNLAELKKRYAIDFCIANGENADDGFGLTPSLAQELFGLGIDVLTSGNHIWQRDEILPFLESCNTLLRPQNYPSPCPGKGTTIVPCGKHKIAVLNLQGRVRLNSLLDCPFKVGLQQVKKLKQSTPLIFVDFHVEDSAEREALAHYLDGQVSAVVGTHTHVATADARLLAGQTAFVGDLGMCGSIESVIGSKIAISIERSLSQMPLRIESETTRAAINGVVITVEDNGRARSISRVYAEETL